MWLRVGLGIGLQCHAHEHALGAANQALLACMHQRGCRIARGQVLACQGRGVGVPMLLLAARPSSLTSQPAAAHRPTPIWSTPFVGFLVSSTLTDSRPPRLTQRWTVPASRGLKPFGDTLGGMAAAWEPADRLLRLARQPNVTACENRANVATLLQKLQHAPETADLLNRHSPLSLEVPASRGSPRLRFQAGSGALYLDT